MTVPTWPSDSQLARLGAENQQLRLRDRAEEARSRGCSTAEEIKFMREHGFEIEHLQWNRAYDAAADARKAAWEASPFFNAVEFLFRPAYLRGTV